MQKFLAVDMFRVVADAERHLTQQTTRGAVLSMIAIFLMAVMCINETYLFFRRDLRSSMSVAKHNFLDMETLHFNISFPQLPCKVLQYEALDPTTGRVFEEQQKTVKQTKIRLFQGTTVALGEFIDNPDDRRQGADEGCQLVGTAEIDKVPGNFLIAARSGTEHYKARPPMDFIIHEFWIGDKRLPVNELPDALANALGGLRAEEGLPWNTVYQIYLSIVPTIFDEGTRKEHLGFQYTATYNHVVADIPPGLYFSHTHSPISVEYSTRSQTWSHFFTNLSAIVGGVFTVVGFASAALDRFFPQPLEGTTSSQ